MVPGLMLASALPAPAAGQSQINVGPQTAPGSTLTAPPQPAQYTGEIVSFDVRDLDLKDFFRLISETSGLNVTTDQNVTGTLPVFRLTDVPWDQALDIVLKQNQLRGELQGNILRIATDATLQSEDTARKAALDAKDAISPLETHTYILNYTKASVVQTTLTQGTSSVVSKRGDISNDDRKNALIITDIPDQFAKIDQIIRVPGYSRRAGGNRRKAAFRQQVILQRSRESAWIVVRKQNREYSDGRKRREQPIHGG